MMVVIDNQVQHCFVKTRVNDDESIEVIEGLNIGKLVVLDGSMGLNEGIDVKHAYN